MLKRPASAVLMLDSSGCQGGWHPESLEFSGWVNDKTRHRGLASGENVAQHTATHCCVMTTDIFRWQQNHAVDNCLHCMHQPSSNTSESFDGLLLLDHTAMSGVSIIKHNPR